MSPVQIPSIFKRLDEHGNPSQRPTSEDGLVLEAWAEGFMIGSLIVMTCITVANMRRGVLLHKLILIELVFGYWQGFFILFHPPIYAWWLSVAAIPLNVSWVLHNVIAWMKLRPFLNRTASRIFLGTVILTIPYWVVEITANFLYFHNINKMFLKTRPWEALCRDPWWIAAALFLMYNIKTKYDLSLAQICNISPRFAVMLVAMTLSIIFIVLDVCSVTGAFASVLTTGINPFWKLSFVFKCLTDCVVLDDFKTALDRLRAFKISRLGSFAMETSDSRVKTHQDEIHSANNWAEPPAGASLGNMPDMPMSMNGTTESQLRTKQDPGASHVEETRPDVYRMASRDRDLEENGVNIIDHAGERDGSFASTSDTDPRQLSNRDSWPPRKSSDRSSDPDIEYAMACRQVATNDTKMMNRQNRESK